MTETIHRVGRILSPAEATQLVGSPVGTELDPSFRSPANGSHVRIVDGDQTVGLVTRLPKLLLAQLRHNIVGMPLGQNVARHRMAVVGRTFGYAPRKAIARQEGCRPTALDRDKPAVSDILRRIASHLSTEFEELLPEQASADRSTVEGQVLGDWLLGESAWTSGVINSSNVLPYHRDGNNLDAWSAMPTMRYRTAGGHLHVPEYGLVFPCGDGDVTWFYGKGLVHGVTNMSRKRGRPGQPDPYRYSIVYYALRGMKDCATYAEETTGATRRRTERERAEVAKIRAQAIASLYDVPVEMVEGPE